jgi:hypothetical protein
MKKTTFLTTTGAGLLATVAMLVAASYAADDPIPQNTTTVWLDGKGQSGFSGKLNKLHADMEAKGLKFTDMEVYVEDGDMQGAFVTYVR